MKAEIWIFAPIWAVVLLPFSPINECTLISKREKVHLNRNQKAVEKKKLSAYLESRLFYLMSYF